MRTMAQYLDSKRIVFLDEGLEKADILSKLIDLIDASGFINNPAQFRADIYERELIMSTGIGLGIAIPHCKSSAVDKLTAAIGIPTEPIEYDALDGKKVEIIIMIATPLTQHAEYLRLLSKITFLLKNKEQRKRVLSATSADELYQIFSTSKK